MSDFAIYLHMESKRRRVEKSARAEQLAALVKWATSRGSVIQGFAFEVGLDGVGVTAATTATGYDDDSEGKARRTATPANQLLLSVPARLVFSAEAALKTRAGQAIVAAAQKGDVIRVPVPIKAVLWSCMIWQRHHPEGAWHTYLSAMPSTFDTPSFYTDAQRRDWLGGTNVGSSLSSHLQKIKTIYDGLFPALHTECPTLFDARIFTWEAFLWAYTAYTSRSFPPELLATAHGDDGGNSMPDGVDGSARAGVMLPLFDMLNHSPQTKVEWLGVAASAAASIEAAAAAASQAPATLAAAAAAAPRNADTVPQVCFRWEAVNGQTQLPVGTEVMNNYGRSKIQTNPLSNRESISALSMR